MNYAALNPVRGVVGSLRRLAANLLAYARGRLELAGLELELEKIRLSRLLVTILLGALFTMLTAFMVALGVIVHYWDSAYRLHAIAVLALLFLAAAGACWLRLRRQLRGESAMFQSTIMELRKDQEMLEHMR